MTENSLTAVKVEQGDREAAARVYDLLGFGPCQHIIDGVEDDIGVVQAFAAARVAAVGQERGAIVSFLRTIRCDQFDEWTIDRIVGGEHRARAIEAGEHGEG